MFTRYKALVEQNPSDSDNRQISLDWGKKIKKVPEVTQHPRKRIQARFSPMQTADSVNKTLLSSAVLGFPSASLVPVRTKPILQMMRLRPKRPGSLLLWVFQQHVGDCAEVSEPCAHLVVFKRHELESLDGAGDR